jgi:hypothetical protein
LVADEKDARHGLAAANSVVSEAGNGIAVVRDQDPFFGGSPGQDRGVWRFSQSDVLNTHDIQVRHAANEAA